MTRPRVVVSACLLGDDTRYDGRIKRAPLVAEDLARHCDLVAVCPEADCGLATPRDPMALVRTSGTLRLTVIATGVDHTERLTRWTDSKLDEIVGIGIHGCVLKSRSPSCGLSGVPYFSPGGTQVGEGAGLFAAAFVERFPDAPAVEDDNLDDTALADFLAQLLP